MAPTLVVLALEGVIARLPGAVHQEAQHLRGRVPQGYAVLALNQELLLQRRDGGVLGEAPKPGGGHAGHV